MSEPYPILTAVIRFRLEMSQQMLPCFPAAMAAMMDKSYPCPCSGDYLVMLCRLGYPGISDTIFQVAK